MGDRFYLELNCAYCNRTNKDVYYAPTCSFYDFTCEHCKKVNFISSDFSVKKLVDVSEQNVIDAFEMATIGGHSKALIKKEAKRYLNHLKGIKQ